MVGPVREDRVVGVAFKFIMTYANRLDRQEWLIALMVVTGLCLLCMRGHGERG
jgi:hypothetical protein